MVVYSDSYTFDPRPHHPLLITAKRYWCEATRSDDKDALTLVCTHGVGASKEHWEPTIELLLQQASREGGGNRDPPIRIREIWSFDAQNHGEAAALNDEAIAAGLSSNLVWQEYAQGVHAVLSGLAKSRPPVNFGTHRLVGVGHSFGALALAHANIYTPKIEFSSLVLIEPVLSRTPLDPDYAPAMARGVSKRKDIWSSRSAAMEQLRDKFPYDTWRPRALEIWEKHCLRDLPTALYPDKQSGVTLACTRLQEAACYEGISTGIYRVTHRLPQLCRTIPVHFIYGEIGDVSPEDLFEETHAAIAWAGCASLSHVPDAGHAVLQSHPEELAQLLLRCLNSNSSRGVGSGRDTRAKL